MSPPGIVERFDVVKDVGTAFIARSVDRAVYPLLLQRGEEALDRGVDAPMSN
jgi:hypothetical protein